MILSLCEAGLVPFPFAFDDQGCTVSDDPAVAARSRTRISREDLSMRLPTSVSPEVPADHAADHWDEVANVATMVDLGCLERVAIMLLDCQARGRVVFVVGNGGSAATASHFACDLVKARDATGRPRFRWSR